MKRCPGGEPYNVRYPCCEHCRAHGPLGPPEGHTVPCLQSPSLGSVKRTRAKP